MQRRNASTSYSESQDASEPTVDFLLLADRAEAINGKLYMMGAAWDRLTVPSFEAANLISLAVGILVPWVACNMQHNLAIDLLDSDRNAMGLHVEATFTAGRPPEATPATAQRVFMAFPVVPITLPRPGVYSIAASINGVEQKLTTFAVVGAPTAAGASGRSVP